MMMMMVLQVLEKRSKSSFPFSFFFVERMNSFLPFFFFTTHSLHTLTTYYSYTLQPLHLYLHTVKHQPSFNKLSPTLKTNSEKAYQPINSSSYKSLVYCQHTHTHTLHAINVVTNTLHRSKTKRKRTSSRTVGRCASACLATRRTEEQKNTPSTSRTHLIHDADSKHGTTERRY